MKQLIWKFVLPLTIISFLLFTKWWYVETADGFTRILNGFPLPASCPGLHTSLSLQIFVLNLSVNVLSYFAFWFTLTYVINRFVKKIKIHKALSFILLLLAGIILTGLIFIAANPDNIYSFKRKFDIEIIETGFKFVWEDPAVSE